MRRAIFLIFAFCAIVCMAQYGPSTALYVTGKVSQNEKQVFSSRMVNILTHSNKFTVVDRSAEIYELLKQERGYQLSGEVDNGEISQIGRELGVDFVIVADLSKLRGGSYFASVRVVDIKTGKIMSSTYKMRDLSSISDIQDMVQSLTDKFLNATPPPRSTQRAAVYVTATKGVNTEYQPIVESIVITGLTNAAAASGISLVERSDDFLKLMRDESDYQMSGGVDTNEIREIGKKFGVKYVYAVVISYLFGEIDINVCRVAIESRHDEVSWSKSGACNSIEQLIALSEELMSMPNGGGGGKRSFNVKGVTFNMVPVKGGSFNMGATYEQGSEFDSDERPVHMVTLSDYMIGETEVTQELWQAVMGLNPSNFQGSKRPVENVSWNDCQEFISRLNQMTGQRFRLPTEAEWEYAARGGASSKNYKYSGSNNIFDVAWFSDNSGAATHNVATKAPNELGIYDMSGNVWEWCSDWYGNYSSSSQTNPTGAYSGFSRVLRGGRWYNAARYCRVANRGGDTPSNRNDSYGLRLAL